MKNSSPSFQMVLKYLVIDIVLPNNAFALAQPSHTWISYFGSCGMRGTNACVGETNKNQHYILTAPFK
jgi:hypothetical protein